MGMKKIEVGMIPEEWNVQTFSDTFRILNNNTFSRAELNYESGQFKNIHYGDVLIRFPEVLDCTRLDVPYINDDCRISGSAQALQDGDVVIADTAEDETVGKVTEVRNTVKKPVMAGLHTIPCRVKSGEFAPMWLGYFMNSHLYHDQLLPYIHGIKVSSISKASLAETIIISSPVEEQEKIVAALSDIDALIWNTEKLIRKYQAVKQACLQRMFPQKGQNEPEMRLPSFTGAWEQRKLGDIGFFERETVNPSDCPNTSFVEYSMPAYDLNRIPVETLGASMKSTRIILDKPTVLINKLNVKQKRIWLVEKPSKNAVASSEFMPFTSDEVNLKFIHQMMLSDKITDDLLSISSGTSNSQKRVTPSDLQNYCVNYPASKEEQSEIGDFLTNLDHLIALHQRKLKKYKNIKQGMIEELLTGKVRLS
ncbi:MAG: restriction endonuclease subunit S [Clostridiales bacterium]|nr:restriction endonuclease subunit S [Clostridiales bacterium]